MDTARLPDERWLEEELCRSDGALLRHILGEHFVASPHAIYRQLAIPGAGIADIVVTIPDDCALAIIELKRTADEAAIAQCLRYKGALKHSLAQRGLQPGILGIVMAYEVTAGALYAVSTLHGFYVGRVPLGREASMCTWAEALTWIPSGIQPPPALFNELSQWTGDRSVALPVAGTTAGSA